MKTIYLFLTISLIWLHLAALTSLVGPRFGSWAIGRAVGVLSVVLLCFFVEHFVGFGSMRHVWPVTAAISAFVLWRNYRTLLESKFLSGEVVFAVVFAYAFTWRILFPSIYPTSERFADLSFLSNYISGETLPPVDHWLPPFKFNYYYSLQYYAAALAGRLFHLTPALSYNFGIPILAALSLSLVWDIASRFISGIAPRMLLVAVIAVGGTGVSVFSHALHQGLSAGAAADHHVVLSARFIGEFERHLNTELGKKMFPPPADPSFVPRGLPLENFSYNFVLAEFHPPQGGFMLLLLALALIAAAEKLGAEEKKKKWLVQAAMGMTVPAVIATNTWVFPFQFLLISCWAVWRTWQGRSDPHRKPEWGALICGGFAAVVLLYPFLTGFATRTAETPIKMVYPQDHTPWRSFLVQFWPLLVLILLGLFNKQSRRFSLFLAVFFASLLFVAEMFFIDDASGDSFERGNTVLKWWAWIWTGGIASLGAVLLASDRRWVKYTAAVPLLATLAYAYDVAALWRFNHETGSAGLYGTDAYTGDPAARDMFRYLAVAPDGIILENQYEDGYHNGGAYAAFSGKPALMGWQGHLSNLRGHMALIDNRRAEISHFYSGEMQQALEWLLDNEVRYVVWNATDSVRADVWEKRNTELAPRFMWRRFSNSYEPQIGLWVRRN
ncbi:MAG: hypothetical protein K0S28_1472 [Paucimonas sp.]|nr:hypothetical protein [Paucimonas sp.]